MPGFEPGSLDSKSKVLTITPQNQKCTQWDSNPRSILHQILSLTPLTAREYVLKYSSARLKPTDCLDEVGFEPTKHDALDLKSNPFDQTREPIHGPCNTTDKYSL